MKKREAADERIRKLFSAARKIDRVWAPDFGDLVDREPHYTRARHSRLVPAFALGLAAVALAAIWLWPAGDEPVRVAADRPAAVPPPAPPLVDPPPPRPQVKPRSEPSPEVAKRPRPRDAVGTAYRLPARNLPGSEPREPLT